MTGNVIHASDIRKSENTAKNNLDARIYRVLKDDYGWWKQIFNVNLMLLCYNYIKKENDVY